MEPFWCPRPPRSEKDRKSDFATPPPNGSAGPAGSSRITTTAIPESRLLGEELDRYDCVVLCDVPRLDHLEISRLARFVEAGGGLVIVYANRFLRPVRNLGIVSGVITAALLLPADVLACAVCLGNTDSILRSGMNMGILVLLGVTGFMLLSFGTFFMYLARRARLVQTENAVLPASHAGSKLRTRTQKGSI